MGRVNTDEIKDRALSPIGTLRDLLKKDHIKSAFTDMLGDKAPAFMSSILSLVGAKKELAKCAPNSIVSACAISATLDLPINPNLGFAGIIPYGGVAQFQIQYKGLIQLAIRTGQYRRMNSFLIHEGELVTYNRITGETVIDEEKRTSDNVVGYGFYFCLTSGFEHTFVMTKEQVEAHAKKYSKAFQYRKKDSPWFTNFDAMALKTVTKLALSKYGILSVQMQKAITYDQGVVKGLEDPDVVYPDNAEGVVIMSAEGETNSTLTAEVEKSGE